MRILFPGGSSEAKSLHAPLPVNSLLGTVIRDSRANKLSTACPSFLVLRVWILFYSPHFTHHGNLTYISKSNIIAHGYAFLSNSHL